MYLFKPIRKPNSAESKTIRDCRDQIQMDTKEFEERAGGKTKELQKELAMKNQANYMTIEKIHWPRKRAFLNLSAEYLGICMSMNWITTIVSVLVYFGSVKFVRPIYAPFGDLFVSSILAVQYFTMHIFIWNKIPSQDNLMRKVLIMIFLTILFSGKVMEVFQICNLQSEGQSILLSIGAGLVIRFLLEFLNNTSMLHSMRFMFGRFCFEEAN